MRAAELFELPFGFVLGDAVSLLNSADEVKLCETDELNGERTMDFPGHADDLAKATPVDRTLPGWSRDTTACRRSADRPANARAYHETIAETLGKELKYVGVGPDREQTIRVGS